MKDRLNEIITLSFVTGIIQGALIVHAFHRIIFARNAALSSRIIISALVLLTTGITYYFICKAIAEEMPEKKERG